MPAIRTSPSALSTSIKAATSAAIASPAPKHRHPSSPSSAPSASKNASSSTPSASKVSNPNLKQATLSFAPKPKPAASSTSSSQAKSTTKAPAATLGLSVPASEPPPTSSTLTPELMARFKKLWPKLPEENASLLELEMRTMAPDWLEVLKGEMSKPTFLELKRFLLKEQASQKVYPPADDIYSFSRLSSISGIKIVIIGQDPYHGPGQAHGLSFSVRKGVMVPPSLKNIYKEIQNEYPSFVPPKHGDLSELAKQGVLLLNTALTVRANQAASHSKAGWEPFTRSIIAHIASGTSSSSSTASPSPHGKVFMCWGKHGENVCKAAGVDPKKNLILKSAHPSPLAAHRGFFDTGHFKQASEWLEKTWGAGEGIDWTKLGQA